MNSRELIEYFEGKLYGYESMITANEQLDNEFGGYGEMTELYREKRDRTKLLLSILSRTRIRETATEPPTRENDMVLAKGALNQRWMEVPYNKVSEDLYPLWTQLPEATI